MEKKIDLIQYISNKTITNKWVNGSEGYFHDFDKDGSYRFLEGDYTEGDRNLPILATGYAGYLIKHWGCDIQKINENYLNMRLEQYENLNKNEPDADLRNLENEFYTKYKDWEKGLVKQSKAIFEFITDDEIKKINGYIDRYFRYVDVVVTKNNLQRDNNNNQQITLSDSLLKLLQESGFIKNATERPLKWIKTNSKTKGKNQYPSKVSFLDLLCLLEYPDAVIKDKKLLSSLFTFTNEKPLTSQNYTYRTDNMGNIIRPIISEYHTELENIVNKSKEK